MVIKARFEVPDGWLTETHTEYSFRFHGYDNMNDEDKFKERWWIGEKCQTAWTNNKNDINIDMNGILQDAKECNLSIDKMLSTAISHEIIHNILTRDINYDASKFFENICYHKNKNFKEWLGGMA